jgi:hypothetical protein
MIRYMRGSIELPLILRADSVSVPKWWVDGSHATHPNMLVIPVVACLLVKACQSAIHQTEDQHSKFNRNRTCCGDFMPSFSDHYFLEAQGYGHQDNSIKTTKAQFSSKRMVASPAANEPNI